MSGRLRFEVWTVPTAATFSRLADNLPVLPGGSGTVVMSDYADATIAVPLDATELPLVAAGALVTVLDGTTVVDEFFAEAVSKEVDGQGTPYASISGPGINGGMAKIAVYPYGLPNDIDWIWGSERNLLTNGGAEDNPLGILNPGFEDGTRAPWWPGALEGVSANLTVDTTTPDTGTFSALVAALINEGGMSTGVKVYPGKEYTLGVRARTPSGSHLWQLGASGPAAIVPGAGATLVEHSPNGQFAPGHQFEAQRNTTFGTTYAAADALIFTAAPDQRSSQVSVRYLGGAAPQSLRVDNFTFTGFGVGVDPWEFTAGVTAFSASQAVTPVEGLWHFAVTAPPNEGVFQGVGNFLPGETVTLAVPMRGVSAHRWSVELRDVRGTVLGQTSAVLGTGAFGTLTLTARLPDFIPGPDGEIQVWVVNRHTASSTAYFDAAMLARGFAAATAGEVLRLLLEAAQARGTGLWLDPDFSDTVDSDGASWPTLPAFQTGPPQTLAHVARNLSQLENGIEWTIVRKATPSGTFTHDLKAYIKGGLGSIITDGSKAVIGTHAGTSLGRLRGFTAAGALGNESLWAEDTDAAGVAAVGRWERAFDVPYLGSTDALADFLDDAFADDEINRTALQVQVRGDAQSVPLLDYRPGDTLPWIVPPHTTASRRVVTISWRHDDLAMYDVTGSKVFPGESALAKAVEILWDEVHGRRSHRPAVARRPEPPSVGGGKGMASRLVASSTADEKVKSKADFIVPSTGSAAALQLVNNEVDAEGGGTIWLAGVFDLDIDMTIGSDVVWRGLGPDHTRLNGDAAITGPGEIYDLELDGTVRFVGIYKAHNIRVSGGNYGANAMFSGGMSSGGGFSDIYIDGCDVDDALFVIGGTGWYFERIYRNSGDGALLRATDGFRAHVSDIHTNATASDSAKTTSSMIFDGCERLTIKGVTSGTDGDSGNPLVAAIRFIDCLRVTIDGLIVHTANSTGVRLEGCNDIIFGPTCMINESNAHGLRISDSDWVSFYGQVYESGSMTDNTYDNIILDGDSNDCWIQARMRPEIVSANDTRYAVNVSASTCDRTTVVGGDFGDVSEYQGSPAFNDAGTGTRITWPADATYGDNFSF